jgi:hypothetical protein
LRISSINSFIIIEFLINLIKGIHCIFFDSKHGYNIYNDTIVLPD